MTSSASEPDGRPPLSVVVGTTQPWPEVEPCLDSFFGEARRLGAEVVVLDRDGRGLPCDAASRYPGVVHMTEPGASIYRLRAVGLAAARGRVVAITEDHCIPRPGWCEGHLRAHADHPEVAVVGGPVENGARRRLSDWAIFLRNHAGYIPPVESGERDALDRANESYKREVLPDRPSDQGMDEPWVDRRLRERGHRLFLDGRIVSDHLQSLGFPGTVAILFHNGRAVAGLRMLQRISPGERVARAVGSLLIPPVFLLQTLGAMARGARLPLRAYASIPLLALFCVVVGAGNLAGYLVGGGSSPHKIR